MTGVQTCALRSEEHTSELQSHDNLVCRLLLEKKIEANPPISTPPSRRPSVKVWSPARATALVPGLLPAPRADALGRLAPAVRCFFFNDTATTEIYTLSLHDALPISLLRAHEEAGGFLRGAPDAGDRGSRSEEHTSELQSHDNLVCRLLLEKKTKQERQAKLSWGWTMVFGLIAIAMGVGLVAIGGCVLAGMSPGITVAGLISFFLEFGAASGTALLARPGTLQS